VLGGEAVILFERHEQKDKSKTPDPKGNTQVIKLRNNSVVSFFEIFNGGSTAFFHKEFR